MDDGTIFYIAGSVLAVSAVVVSFAGLKAPKPIARAAPLIVIWFVALIGISATYAVLHSQHEEEPHEQAVGLPQATEEAEAIEDEAPGQ
jgi:hypothetical protein